MAARGFIIRKYNGDIAGNPLDTNHDQLPVTFDACLLAYSHCDFISSDTGQLAFGFGATLDVDGQNGDR